MWNSDGTQKTHSFDSPNAADGHLSGKKKSQFAVLKREARLANKKLKKMKKKLKYAQKHGKRSKKR